MKRLIFLTVFILIYSFGESLYTLIPSSTTLFVKNKFFIKTEKELSVSEATGSILPSNTGIISLDILNEKFGVKKIERFFDLNNGDKRIYDSLEMSKVYVLYLDNVNLSIINEYADAFDIEYSEPNFIGTSAGVKSSESMSLSYSPNDTYYFRQWYLKNTGGIKPTSGNPAKIGADIGMEKAWDIEQGDENIIIAILDSGIEDFSPDLRGRLWINAKEIPDNGIDDDRNGYVDDIKGWDFAYNDNFADDGFGHGTNIASTIGARTNNNFGFAGINMNSKLMNCKNLSDNNYGEYAWWAKSAKYAADNGAKIINMSEGGEDYSKVLKTAVDYAMARGALIVAAMMNKANGKDYYPAAYKGVLAVGATDSDDKRCKKFSWGGGSCWGKHISVVAPGNRIYGVDYENAEKFDTYWSGTSQSTAIVSAIASLVLSQDKSRTSEDIKEIIISTAKDLVGEDNEDKAGWDQYYGYGRVDCYAALTYRLDLQKEKLINKDTSGNNKEDKEDKEDKQAKSIREEEKSSRSKKSNPSK